MSGSLVGGRNIRTLNKFDDFNREGLGVDIDLSFRNRIDK
jgi:hypothetical protein